MKTITKCMHHIFIFEWLNVIIIPNGRLIICWSSWNIGTIWNFAGGHALDKAWSDAFSVCYKWDGIFTWVWYSTEIADWEWNKWVSKSHRQRFLGGILCYLGIFYFRHISLYISLESHRQGYTVTWLLPLDISDHQISLYFYFCFWFQISL